MKATVQVIAPMMGDEIKQFYVILSRISESRDVVDLSTWVVPYIEMQCPTFRCDFGGHHFWVKHQDAMEENMIFVEF